MRAQGNAGAGEECTDWGVTEESASSGVAIGLAVVIFSVTTQPTRRFLLSTYKYT